MLKTEKLSLHGKLGAERAALARELMHSIRLKRDRKKAVEEKEEAAHLLAAEKTRRENSAVAELLKEDVLTVALKAAEQIGALSVLLGQVVMEIEALKTRREFVIHELG